MSAYPCGCAHEAKHMCAFHEAEEADYWASLGRQQPDGFTEEVHSLEDVKDELELNETIEDALRSEFPHGHPEFLPTTLEEMSLHSQKNHDYASGGDPLGNFKRVASILSNYPNLSLSDPRVVALVYTLKQLDAVLWGLNSNIEHKVEGLIPRLQDISVYTKIVLCMQKDIENGV